MDNVIRLSKFVKNLGIVTTVLFLIIVLVTFVTGNMGVAICFMPFVFLGIALILAYKKQIIVVNEDEIVFMTGVEYYYEWGQIQSFYDDRSCQTGIVIMF
jgi:hypothetical protein